MKVNFIDISEDLRDNKGYSEEEIKGFLIEQILV
jgi:hypothetical protein